MQGEAFLRASRLERPSLDTTLPGSTGDAAAYGHPGVQVEPAETAKKARPPHTPRRQEGILHENPSREITLEAGFRAAQPKRDARVTFRVAFHAEQDKRCLER